ncbi:hypothetical protein AB9K41_02715 [Cribrihabitans sp. XS_ASV171]
MGKTQWLMWKDEASETRRAFAGRRVLTGDVGRLDTNGFLFFEGHCHLWTTPVLQEFSL